MNGVRRGSLVLAVIFLLCGTGLPAAAHRVSSREVINACREYVLARTGYSEEEMFFDVIRELPPLDIPSDDYVLEVDGDVGPSSKGRLPLKVRAVIDGKTYQVLYPVCEVDLKKKAFITTRWIKRREAISEDDVSEVEMRQSKLPPRALSDSDQWKGMVTKVGLPRGRILAANHLELPPLISKNSPVGIVARNEEMTVKARGIALADGVKGEIIKVKNLDSEKVVYGEVIGKSVVEVRIP